MLKRVNILWPVGLFLLSLLVRFVLLDYAYVKVIEADGFSYVDGARAFWQSFDVSKINIIDQPLFSILIAFFSSITPDWEMAGRVTSITAGSLIGPLVFLISKEKGNTLRVSILAGLIISITPLYTIASFQVFSDTLNCSLLLFGVWQLFVALKDYRGVNFFFSGAGFSLAYLTRHDSIVPSFFAFLVIIYFLLKSGIKRKKMLAVSAFPVAFIMLALPYILFLHAELGVWVISGRQIPAQANIADIKGGNYEDRRYGLTEDLELKGEVTNMIKAYKTKKNQGFVDYWIEDTSEMFTFVLKNFKIEWNVFLDSVPWYLIFFAIISVLSQRLNFFSNNLPLFAFSSPLIFLYPFFWPDPRHLYHFMLPVWLWAVEGVELLPSIMPKVSIWKRTFQNLSYPEILKYCIYALVLMLAIASIKPKEIGPQQLVHLKKKAAGEWISQNTPRDSVVMARWPRTRFYTDRKTVVFPYAEWTDIKKYMKKNGVTHLVLDESFYYIRPQARHLLNPLLRGTKKSLDKDLSLLVVKRDRFGGMIVYKVKGES